MSSNGVAIATPKKTFRMTFSQSDGSVAPLQALPD
jgi:hypothetical protein